MDKTKLKRLIEINLQIRALSAEKAGINEEVLAEMVNDGELQRRTPYGVFSIVRKKSYEYPAWYLEQIDSLDLAKKEATKKAKKESTYAITNGLMFKPNDIMSVGAEEFEVEVVREGDEGKPVTPVEPGQTRVHS